MYQALFYALAIQHTAPNPEGARHDVLAYSGSSHLPPETLSSAKKSISLEQYILLSTFYEPTGSLNQSSSSRHGFEFISQPSLCDFRQVTYKTGLKYYLPPRVTVSIKEDNTCRTQFLGL